MKVLQLPISENHHNAMFFDGIVAVKNIKGNYYSLRTFQSGEIIYDGKQYCDKEIIKLATLNLISDNDIDNETHDILIDKFFAIYLDDELLDQDEGIYSGDYEDAVHWFEVTINCEDFIDGNIEQFNFNENERKFAAFIINQYGTGQHPVANTFSVVNYSAGYLAAIIQTRKFNTADLSPAGIAILSTILTKMSK